MDFAPNNGQPDGRADAALGETAAASDCRPAVVAPEPASPAATTAPVSGSSAAADDLLGSARNTAVRQGRAHHTAALRWLLYFAKAVLLLGALFLASRFAGSLPPLALALLWAVLSGASALGIAYHVVIRKTHRQFSLRRGGLLARLNAGRVGSLVVAFVASAACMASLMLQAATWVLPEWCLVAAAALLFPLVFLLADRFLGKEYEPAFRVSKAAKWSAVAICILLCVAYLVLLRVQPAATYDSAAQAFDAVSQPYESSPSALASEAGTLTALVDGVTDYGTSKAAQTSLVGYLAWRVVLAISAFLGVASLLGLCSLEWRELKRVFLPLEAGKDEVAGVTQPAAHRVVKKYAAVAGVLPIVLVAAFLVADAGFALVRQTEEFTAAGQLVRDQVGVAVAVIDGEFYEQQAAQQAAEELSEKSAQLSQEAKDALVPLINSSFDARLNNVDSYLDWYYSLPADYERLIKMITGTVEDYVAEQFTSKIEEGIDDTQLASELEGFSERAASLQSAYEEALANSKLEGVPEWLVVARQVQDATQAPDEPTQKLMDASARLGLSAGTSLATGTIAKQLVKKAAEKQFFKEIAKRIASALSSRGVGAAVGGALGTVAGPAGTAAGAVVGTAAGFGVDFGLLKLDEFMNREQYRQEIVDTIEEGRAEMLALVE